MPAKNLGQVKVRTPGGAYSVVIGRGALNCAAQLDALGGARPWVVVTDTTVWRRWGLALSDAFAPRPLGLIRIKPGEDQKRLATVERICEQLVRVGADRSTLVIGFGGGVVGDMAGFAASIFLRGVDYVHIPTTLLAQIDSSVGGKTGVNLTLGKNLAGTFYQPKGVFADPEVLRTLPPREYNAGIYEAIKCGVLRRPLFEFLEEHRRELAAGDFQTVAELVRQCVELKAWVVSRDEREAGLRRILNLGHTIGHALEADTGYSHYLHGEAVAWGLRAAAMLAEQLKMLPAREAERIHALVIGWGPLPPPLPVAAARLERLLGADKKTRAGIPHFVLPRRIGQVEVVTGIEPRVVARIIEQLAKEHSRQSRRRHAPRSAAGKRATSSAASTS